MKAIMERPGIQPKVGKILIEGNTFTYEYNQIDSIQNPDSVIEVLEKTDLIKRTIDKGGLVRIVSKSFSIVDSVARIVSGTGYNPKNSYASMLKIDY